MIYFRRRMNGLRSTWYTTVVVYHSTNRHTSVTEDREHHHSCSFSAHPPDFHWYDGSGENDGLHRCPHPCMHIWIKTFFKPMWLTLKVVRLPCTTSASEHSWSIEGCIHSNRRNRLGQKLVKSLVRTHTNLKLERLEIYETGLCLTTTTDPPTESLTPSSNVNPSKTLTIFLFDLVWHTGYPFLYFYIFVLLVHIGGSQTCCFQNTTTVSDTQHTFH
jgi:hypothetical protein